METYLPLFEQHYAQQRMCEFEEGFNAQNFFSSLSHLVDIYFSLSLRKHRRRYHPQPAVRASFLSLPFGQMRGREKPCFYPQLLINKPPLFQEIISYHILEEGGSMPRTFFTTLSLPPHTPKTYNMIYSVRHVFFTSRYDIILNNYP